MIILEKINDQLLAKLCRNFEKKKEENILFCFTKKYRKKKVFYFWKNRLFYCLLKMKKKIVILSFSKIEKENRLSCHEKIKMEKSHVLK